MKRISLGALSIATSAVAIAFVVWLIGFFGPGGFADGKAIRARLQGMELEHRNRKIMTLEVFAEYKDTEPIVVLEYVTEL